MLENDIAQLVREGASQANGFVRLQPELWGRTLDLYKEAAEDLDALLGRARGAAGVYAGDDHEDGSHAKLPVLLMGTGAAFNAGVEAVAHLVNHGIGGCTYAVASADDVAASPLSYVGKGGTVLAVALSLGDDPALGDALRALKGQAAHVFGLGVSCASDDPLAAAFGDDDDALVLTLPVAHENVAARDAGGTLPEVAGFTCLSLFAQLALAGDAFHSKVAWAEGAQKLGQMVVMRETEVAGLVTVPFERLAFLCDGIAFGGVAREAVREAERVQTRAGAPLFARFGDVTSASLDPDRTHDALTLAFVPSEPADDRSQFLADLALIEDGAADNGCTLVAVQQDEEPRWGQGAFTFDGCACLPSGYLALPYLMVAQQAIAMAAVK